MSKKSLVVTAFFCGIVLVMTGCQTPGDYHRDADEVAYKIIKNKQKQALGHTQRFTIATPAQSLWAKLLKVQNLPYPAPASLGVAALKPLEHWPQDPYLQVGKADTSGQSSDDQTDNHTIILSLPMALEVAAHNSHEYQSQKELVYKSALNLDLAKNNFRTIFSGELGSQVQGNFNGDHSGVSGTISGDFTKQFKNGITVTGALTQTFISMLTGGYVSVSGLSGDTSVNIPLLRGAGQWVVAEPLTQAQRNVIYAIRTFERYKKAFAVRVASQYLSVLQRRNTIANDAQNYRNVTIAVRRSRIQAEAGRLPAIQVGQAVQRQLSARSRWIAAEQNYQRQLDQFKDLLGLPVDAKIKLEQNELSLLAAKVKKTLPNIKHSRQNDLKTVPPANAPVQLKPIDPSQRGPLEIGYTRAIELAFGHRLDLRNAKGAVYDAQRKIPIRANSFLPQADITLGATMPQADISEINNWNYNAGINIDLPLNHVPQRNQYRKSIINLQQTVRSFQDKVNQIKLAIRDELRSLAQSREGLRIQSKAVKLAKQRVSSTQMFFDAGRIEIRDVLDAQQSLVSAQNALTASLVNYRVAELQIQRDMGVLKVNANGLMSEYTPGKIDPDQSVDANNLKSVAMAR